VTTKTGHRARAAACTLLLLSLGACGSDTVLEPPVHEAKGGPKGGASADPSWGHQGDIQLEVRVLGSGFDPSAQASWERDGAPDPKVTVRSTRFVSSAEVVATIDIAADAQVDLYDVAVYIGIGDSRKKGVGIEAFQVTTAEETGVINARSWAAETSLSGELMIVGIPVGPEGEGAFIWTESRGRELLTTAGGAWDVDRAGTTVVGGIEQRPHVFQREGSGWIAVPLAYDYPDGGTLFALGDDPLTGEARFAVGRQRWPDRKTFEAALWVRDPASGAWGAPLRLPMPGGAKAAAYGVSNDGSVIVGSVWQSNRANAAVWEGTPSGGYQLTLLPPAPGASESTGEGVSPGGGLIVGSSRGRTSGGPTVWERGSDGSWTPRVLPGDGLPCGGLQQATDRGEVVGGQCVWDLSAGGDPQILSGLDVNGEKPIAYAITSDGRFVAGTAGGRSAIEVVYWRR